MNLEHFIWTEKYRPQTIDDCILPKKTKEYFKEMVKSGEIPNLLLYGKAGCGKTTIAKALCNELGADWLFINGSEDSGIDTLRHTIREFASTISLQGKTKVVIIDEADYLNPTSFMPAFRSFLEEFAANCRFILTCNNQNKIIPPLRSRLTPVDFTLDPEDMPVIAKHFFSRVLHILKSENVEAKNDVVAALIKKFFPDFRKTILELQRFTRDGKIEADVLSIANNVDIKELSDHLKKKEWKEMRQWVADKIADYDASELFRAVYEHLVDQTEQAPHLVVLIGEYQYKSAFVVDQEINFTAFLTEVMANVEFNK